ncbi:hypothetical protein MTO96_051025 [Rhipicephalus appendiculatus]
MVCPDEGGTGIALPNGTWIGLVGDLYRNRADIVITPISVTYERTQVVNFSPQIMAEYLAILAGFPDLVEVSAFGTLMAFHWQVWAGLLISLLACVVTGVLVDIGLRIKGGVSIRLWRIFEENWWLYFSAMFMESSTRMPLHTPGRLVLGKSLDVEEYRKVWHLIVTHDGLREASHLYDEENLREVLQGKAVIVSDYTTTLYHASQTCRLRLAAGSYYFAKEPTFSTKLSLAVSRSVDPDLFELINERLEKACSENSSNAQSVDTEGPSHIR